MFKKLIVVTALTLAMGQSYATSVGYQPGNSGNNNVVTQNALSNNANGGNANATGGVATATGGTGGNANQGQGQLQGQAQSIKNSGNSSSSSGGNIQSNAGNNSTNTASGNSTNVSVEGDNFAASRIPVATAYAAPLTSGADTCMGSSSGGVQAPGLGVSFGTTWTDGNCVLLKNAKMMDGLGYRDVALSMMCADASVAAAMKATGRVCPTAPVEEQKIYSVAEPKEPNYSLSSGADMNDPYIRNRLVAPKTFK